MHFCVLPCVKLRSEGARQPGRLIHQGKRKPFLKAVGCEVGLEKQLRCKEGGGIGVGRWESGCGGWEGKTEREREEMQTTRKARGAPMQEREIRLDFRLELKAEKREEAEETQDQQQRTPLVLPTYPFPPWQPESFPLFLRPEAPPRVPLRSSHSSPSQGLESSAVGPIRYSF